jgi:hypothetical protein
VQALQSKDRPYEQRGVEPTGLLVLIQPTGLKTLRFADVFGGVRATGQDGERRGCTK